MKNDISTLDQLEIFVRDTIAQFLVNKESACLMTLRGGLGAGKTTFTQLLGKELGVKGEITSPTYVIEQRYSIEHELFDELIHIDAYRLEDEDDPIKIGLDQTLADPKKLVVIEWPEKIQDFLADYKKHELVFVLDGDARSIEHS